MRISTAVYVLVLFTITAMAQEIDYQYVQGAEATEARQRWAQATQGENLALGKRVLFSITPDDTLTTDANDPLDLTDGQLTARMDDRIWFERDAVGWQKAENGVNLMIDLGQTQPVSHVAARFLGGKEQGGLVYPQQVSIVVSEDGNTFYNVVTRQKLLPAEKELAVEQPESYFFIPENGLAATETFVFRVDRLARYVGLKIKSDGGWLFTDQVAVMKQDQASRCKSADQGLSPTEFIIRGVGLFPRQREEMVITTNIQTPNYFMISDARAPEGRGAPVRFFIDLPKVLDVKPVNATATRADGPSSGTSRWTIENFYDASKAGEYAFYSMYISLPAGQTLSDGAVAVLSCDDPESNDNAITVPLRAVEIPTVGDVSRLDVSIAWMQEMIQWARDPNSVGFPNLLPAFKQMGFNNIPTFPHYFTEAQEPILRKMIDDARAQGHKIIDNESPFHTMLNNHKDKPEIYSIINGQPGKQVCMTYTGQYYQEDMAAAKRYAQIVRPDFVFHDIEMWYYPAEEARQCERCQKAFAESGIKDWDQFLLAQGTRMMKDLFEAAAGTAPDGSDPITGLYNVHIARPIYERAYDFNQIYPKYVQLSQPSLYIGSRVPMVHDTIRQNFELLKSKQIIPWLTTGTYGEFPSRYVEPILLECFLNGARGVGYFMYLDFDPMDFYYHAATMKLIEPYVDLVADGTPIKIEGDNKDLYYSCLGTDREALVLVGNYDRAPNGKTCLKLNDRRITEVLDVKSGATMKPFDLRKLNVPVDEHRLLHVKFE